MHGADYGSFSAMLNRAGRAPTSVLETVRGKHSSSTILWGALLGVGLVFECLHCTIAWSIGNCRSVGLWFRADDIRQGVQGIGRPFLGLPIHHAEPHTVLVRLALVGTTDGLISPCARALCHALRIGEDMIHMSNLGTFTHHPNTMEKRNNW